MVVVVVFNGYIFHLLLKPSTDSSMEQKFPVSAKISAHTHQSGVSHSDGMTKNNAEVYPTHSGVELYF